MKEVIRTAKHLAIKAKKKFGPRSKEAKKKFGPRSKVVSEALQSPTPGATIRALMRDNIDNLPVLRELHHASHVHKLEGRP